MMMEYNRWARTAILQYTGSTAIRFCSSPGRYETSCHIWKTAKPRMLPNLFNFIIKTYRHQGEQINIGVGSIERQYCTRRRAQKCFHVEHRWQWRSVGTDLKRLCLNQGVQLDFVFLRRESYCLRDQKERNNIQTQNIQFYFCKVGESLIFSVEHQDPRHCLCDTLVYIIILKHMRNNQN